MTRSLIAAFALLLAGSITLHAGDLSRRERERIAQDAQRLFDEGKHAEAEAAWRRALGGAKKSQARRWRPWIGRAREVQGDYAGALTAYQEAFDIDPGNVDRLVDLARLLDTVELDAQAIRRYEEALRAAPGRRDVALALARLYHEAGRLADAEVQGRSAVAADPRDQAAQELLARIEEARGNMAEAARRRELLLMEAPTAAGHRALGWLHARQDALEAAEVAFARADAAEPEGPEAAFARAAVAWRRDQTADAGLRLSEALRRNPDFYPARFLSAVVEMEAGRPLRARDNLRGVDPPDATTKRWEEMLWAVLQKMAPETP